jgi:hypothetical protein
MQVYRPFCAEKRELYVANGWGVTEGKWFNSEFETACPQFYALPAKETIHQIWLVQRCKIKDRVDVSNISNTRKLSIDECLSYDYMGSSEFEGFGGVSTSLRRMRNDQFAYTVRKMDIKVRFPHKRYANGKERNLYLYSFFGDEHYKAYAKNLKDISVGAWCVKESIGLTHLVQGRPTIWHDDFWWDIENDCMFSFRVDMIEALAVCIQNSYAKIDKEKDNAS